MTRTSSGRIYAASIIPPRVADIPHNVVVLDHSLRIAADDHAGDEGCQTTACLLYGGVNAEGAA